MAIESERISQAKQLIDSVRGKRISPSDRTGHAIRLAALILEESHALETHAEKDQQSQLARMMQDPAGKTFTTQMTDECFRSRRNSRVADQILFLLKKQGVPKYLSRLKQMQLKLFQQLGSISSALVPFIKAAIRKETARVILPGEHGPLSRFMRKRKREGVQLNLNHLGEAILGEEEACKRLNVYLEDLAKPEVSYISVKISTIFSQLNLLAWEDSLQTLGERLKKLYRAAESNLYQLPTGEKIPKFVNLDMEEYRDLYLTVAAFRRALDDPEFHGHSAGIVLQSYIPESFTIQQNLTVWALQRVARGGAPIKIRIVKGANLAMEKVDASLHGWPQAPYKDKLDVDANFKRMLAYACEPERARAVHIGVGSHNLFDLAYALLLRSEKQVEQFVTLEMLEGMADPTRRAVQKLTGTVLLYCPIADKREFQNAVAYLIRRLDENTGSQNYLRHAFGLHPGSMAWRNLTGSFMDACQKMGEVSFQARRTQNRLEPPLRPDFNCRFTNEPDTDWTLIQNRDWAEKIYAEWSQKQIADIPLMVGGSRIFPGKAAGEGCDPSRPQKTLYHFAQADTGHVDQALKTAVAAQKGWGATTPRERSVLMAEAAHRLRRYRGRLIGAMVADTGKTIPEADVEVSEAVDFVEYYRRSMEEIAALPDIQWLPKGPVVVTPPWNFPCSIPVGGIAAALAAGNCVILKPANEAVLVAWELMQCFWDAGISHEVLQFLPSEDDPVGSQLIRDPRVAAVLLTGATATAKLFLKMRPGLDLMAETGGKNAIIVTGLSDRDLVIKDVVQSAFGHAGQKCSACSLLILEKEVYEDEHFLNSLRDAAASLRVGAPWNPANVVPPLIRPPGEALKRGMTTLEEGESWLLEPKCDPQNPNLWTPGIKLGVQAGSFTHTTELFGPLLAVMKAEDLQHALKIANGTPYGLTSGLHSLDEREQAAWVRGIEAGNCYINRGITGAIVQRQPFGGCKASGFGPGAKAGGPNYVMQLLQPMQISLPKERERISPHVAQLDAYVRTLHWDEQAIDIWNASLGSYAFFWQHYFSKDSDPSKVLGQDNLFRYVPQSESVLRVQAQDPMQDVFRAIAAALTCGASLEVSAERPLGCPNLPNISCIVETEEHFCIRAREGKIARCRLLSDPSEAIKSAMADAGANLLAGPVMANGRIELLKALREVSISSNYHRYGYLGRREEEKRAPPPLSKQDEGPCDPLCSCLKGHKQI